MEIRILRLLCPSSLIVTIMEDTEALIKGLSDIHTYLTRKLSISEASTATAISRRPQSQATPFLHLSDSLLLCIFSYLDFITDIPMAIETCYKFSRLLRSTQFQYYLYQKPSHKPKIKSIAPNPEATPSESEVILTKTEEDQLSKEEATLRLQKANKIKEVLAGKIIKQEKMIESLTNDMEKIEREILTEKSNNSKNLARVAELQREYEKYKGDIEANQVKLKDMHEKHAVQMQNLQTTIGKLQGDIKELEEHKRMLRAEVLRLREESGAVTMEIEGYRSALTRMQKYFNAMFPTEGKKQGT